jgi:tRNA threonylcarbamoyladenosine biosynthesis protein TsaB
VSPNGRASGARHDGRRRAILAIDTATTRVVIASGSPDGQIDGITTWAAGYRHGETLLPSIARFLGEQNLRRSRLIGIVVGTGPGAFTGLRVGIATAKGLAHGLGLPIAGVSTAEAILAAAVADGAVADGAVVEAAAASGRAKGRPVLLLPAGPSDRVIIRSGSAPALLPGGTDPDLAPGEWLVAVDLEGRAPDDAVSRGERARQGLANALVRMGAERLRDGHEDDLAGLVPEYVTLPRGIVAQPGEVAWSRDPR